MKFGKRVVVIGPSNSGKSTLAERLAKKLGVPVLHLDQVAHVPGSRWRRRPDAEFVAAHDAFIKKAGWVIEGNYQICMPPRLDRATQVVWCDPPLAGCIWRYLKRSWKGGERVGRLADAQGEFSWGLIRYTLRQYPKNKLKYRALLAARPKLPVTVLERWREIRALSDGLAR